MDSELTAPASFGLCGLCALLLLAPALGWAQATAPAGEPPAAAGAEPTEGLAVGEEGEGEEPLERYIADILVFAYDSIDTSAEHWTREADGRAAVMHLFLPDLSTGGGFGLSRGLGYTNRSIGFSDGKSIDSSHIDSPIDGVLRKLESFGARPLLRRQWLFNEFDFGVAPRIRLNDYQVYLPKRPPAPPPLVAEGGAPTAESQPQPPQTILLEDLSRCHQDSKRRLRPHRYADETKSEMDGSVLSRDDVKEIFSEPGSPDAPASAQSPPTPEASAGGESLDIDDYVQIALMTPSADLGRTGAPVLEEMNLDGVNANRVDGHIKLFLSRYHHAELQLQYMRPFLTDSTPNRWPATEQRQPCLLAFNIEESRRLKRAETHYFDHPAFGAILYFNVHAPEPPPEEPAPAGAP